VSAIKSAIEDGTSFGAPTERETILARMITEALPSMELVRFVNSGTEATMSALRVARAFTKRDKILKFAGCYHGHSDGLLARAGSGVATFGLPDSAGVPKAYTRNTIVAAYNDLKEVEQAFRSLSGQIACIIVEPVAANMGVVQPKEDFLQGLRRIADANGSLLIFDEVITGFRVSYGGAQELYGVMPDLTCLGKIIGGGFPVGAFGGRREIMEHLAPSGPVYQAGTLSGNPVAMAAGLANLKVLSDKSVYRRLEVSSARLAEGLKAATEAAGIDFFATRVGSMSCLFFTKEKVFDYQSAKTSDTAMYAHYFAGMLDRGVYLAPSQFEAMFVSLAHSNEDIDQTIEAARQTLKEVGKATC